MLSRRDFPTILMHTTALLVVLSMLMAACGGAAADRPPSVVIPLDGAGHGRSSGEADATHDADEPDPNRTPRPTTQAPGGNTEIDQQDGRDMDDTAGSLALLVAADALSRYDEAVTALAVDPVTAADATSAVRELWDRTVTPGSLLHDDVLERMVLEPLANGTRLLPGPEGVGHRHHVTAITGTGDDHISFTWCGYSPGIRVERGSGAVVDDHVAVMGGVGRVVRRHRTPTVADESDRRWSGTGESDRDAGAWVNPPANDGRTGRPTLWMLEELDHLDFDVSPPGSPDPCIP